MDMRILTIQRYNFQKPAFTAWNRDVYDDKGYLKHRNDTSMFRGDIDWVFFARYLDAKYKNVDKVNVYDFGCSDGSEVYTFVISMLNNAESQSVKKFLPIKAYDIDDIAINKAKKGGLKFTLDEKAMIHWHSKFGLDAFFDKNKDETYKPQKVLSKNIIFKKGDITKDFKKIKSENSVVLARNFLPYLGDVKTKELIQNLGKVMGENSFLVLGNYDKVLSLYEDGDTIDVILSKAGFKPTLVENVFEKRSSKTNNIKFDSVIV